MSHSWKKNICIYICVCVYIYIYTNVIELGIKGGPKIKIPITSLQSNTMIVNSQNEDHEEKHDHNKTKINSNIIHNRFHRSHGTIATR